MGDVGVQSIHMRKSMSWQDFVRRDGAEVDSLRQLPLLCCQLSGYVCVEMKEGLYRT